MDFSLIKSKLSSYTSPKEFCSDIRLIWNNCYTFNDSSAEVVTWAKTLSNSVEILIEEYLGSEFSLTSSKTQDDAIEVVEVVEETGLPKKARSAIRHIIKELSALEHADVFMYPVDSS